MGRSRWLCYGMNADRRRQEEMERRLGIRPEDNERGDREPQGAWPEGLPRKTFNRHWVWGRGQAILTPRLYLQIHHGLVHPRPLQGVAVGFGQVPHGPGVDHFRFHIPGPQGVGQASHGMGINLQRPHLAGPQYYQPLPLHQFRKRMLKTPPQSHLMLGKAPPKPFIPNIES